MWPLCIHRHLFRNSCILLYDIFYVLVHYVDIKKLSDQLPCPSQILTLRLNCGECCLWEVRELEQGKGVLHLHLGNLADAVALYSSFIKFKYEYCSIHLHFCPLNHNYALSLWLPHCFWHCRRFEAFVSGSIIACVHSILINIFYFYFMKNLSSIWSSSQSLEHFFICFIRSTVILVKWPLVCLYICSKCIQKK